MFNACARCLLSCVCVFAACLLSLCVCSFFLFFLLLLVRVLCSFRCLSFATAAHLQLLALSSHLQKLMQTLSTKYEELKKTLNEDETYTQLVNLEKKWQYLAKNNFSKADFIAAKEQEADTSYVSRQVMAVVAVSQNNTVLLAFLLLALSAFFVRSTTNPFLSLPTHTQDYNTTLKAQLKPVQE